MGIQVSSKFGKNKDLQCIFSVLSSLKKVSAILIQCARDLYTVSGFLYSSVVFFSVVVFDSLSASCCFVLTAIVSTGCSGS